MKQDSIPLKKGSKEKYERCLFLFIIQMIVFKFQPFKFDGICQTVALSLCPLMGKFNGIEAICYSRNVEIGGLIIFQPGQNFLDSTNNRMTYIFLFSYINYESGGYLHDSCDGVSCKD